MVQKSVRKFATEVLEEWAPVLDRESRPLPPEIVAEMGRLNIWGMQAPARYGGADLDSISYAIAIEEISRVSAAVGLGVTVHNSVCLAPLLKFGTPGADRALRARPRGGQENRRVHGHRAAGRVGRRIDPDHRGPGRRSLRPERPEGVRHQRRRRRPLPYRRHRWIQRKKRPASPSSSWKNQCRGSRSARSRT